MKTKPRSAKAKGHKKDPRKLIGRFALDFAALRSDLMQRAGVAPPPAAMARAGAIAEQNPALKAAVGSALATGSPRCRQWKMDAYPWWRRTMIGCRGDG